MNVNQLGASVSAVTDKLLGVAADLRESMPILQTLTSTNGLPAGAQNLTGGSTSSSGSGTPAWLMPVVVVAAVVAAAYYLIKGRKPKKVSLRGN